MTQNPYQPPSVPLAAPVAHPVKTWLKVVNGIVVAFFSLGALMVLIKQPSLSMIPMLLQIVPFAAVLIADRTRPWLAWLSLGFNALLALVLIAGLAKIMTGNMAFLALIGIPIALLTIVNARAMWALARTPTKV